MCSSKPRLRFCREEFRGGQLAHENNEYFTPTKLLHDIWYNTTELLIYNYIIIPYIPNTCTSLGSLHCFTPLAIETTGVLGPKSMTFVKELGGRVPCVTGDQKSSLCLLQRLSVAVQRGNAASVMGTMDSQTLSLETLEL